MRQRQVTGVARCSCKGEADYFRCHVVEAGRFCVEARKFGRLYFSQPVFELLASEDGFVVGRDLRLGGGYFSLCIAVLKLAEQPV